MCLIEARKKMIKLHEERVEGMSAIKDLKERRRAAKASLKRISKKVVDLIQIE